MEIDELGSENRGSMNVVPCIEHQQSRLRARLRRYDRDGATRDADETFVFVHDLNVPDVRRATDVNRSRCSLDGAFGLRANVVGVDLETDRAEMLLIDIDDRSDRCDRLR